MTHKSVSTLSEDLEYIKNHYVPSYLPDKRNTIDEAIKSIHKAEIADIYLCRISSYIHELEYSNADSVLQKDEVIEVLRDCIASTWQPK